MKFTLSPHTNPNHSSIAPLEFSALIVTKNGTLPHHTQETLHTIFKHLTIVYSGQEGIDLHQKGQFDAVYVDLDLVDIRGAVMIKKIKSYAPGQLCVVLADEHETKDLFPLIQMEIFAFISKPVAHHHVIAISHSIVAYLMQERYYDPQTECIKKESCKLNEETKFNEQLLIQQQKMGQMGEMMSMIAHQWRQPLSAITTIIGALRMKMSLDYYTKKENPLETLQKELSVAFDKIEHSATFLSNTINDFRNFYSPNKPKVTFEVAQMLQRVCQMVFLDKGLHNIKLHLELAHEIEIFTYENELMQVILNLLNNSKDAIIEHGIENPLITITLRADENQVFISIIDNAGGIPDNVIHKIFDPYFSTKKQKNGTGLGLYMSKTIVQTHLNGSITVANLSNGAHFEITLPRTTEGNIR